MCTIMFELRLKHLSIVRFSEAALENRILHVAVAEVYFLIAAKVHFRLSACF